MTATYMFKGCDGVTGIPTVFLPQFQDASTSFEMSDVGSISFGYLKTGVNASYLQQNLVEIAIFQNGVEMDDGRFTVQSFSSDEIANDEPVKYTGVSLSNMLKKAIVYSADDSRTLGVDQVFVGATAGGILKALFNQNKARGTNRVMDRITYASFGSTTDSNGSPWAFTIGEITYTVGVNYLDVMRNLFNNGMIEWKMVGRDLRVYNAGTMGTDHTLDADPVVLRKGRDLTEAPISSTREAVSAVALVVGNENVLSEFVDTSVAAAWGEDETFISQGGISDPSTLAVLSQQAVAAVSEVRVQNTHKIALASSAWTPYVHYKTSDYIYTDRGQGLDRLRIRQMVIDIEAGESSSVSLVLNDKFLEQDIINSRRINGILGGASSTGSVAVPTDPGPEVDTTIPKAPTAVTANSAVGINSAGSSVAVASLTWPAVVQNTDGSTLSDLDHYETQYKTDTATSVTPFSALGPARDDEVMTRKFDRRGKGYGWLGGDGGDSQRATSGKDFWVFSDTNLGTADQSGKIGTDWSFIHNSIVITNPTDTSVFQGQWGMGNKLSKEDAWFDTTIGLWQADTNCAVIRDTSAFFYGTASMKITATAAADAVARIAAPATSAYIVSAFDVFSASARVKTLSGTARNVVLSIRWYDASNALLSTTTGSSVAGSTTVWTRYNVKGTAPINAVRGTVLVTIKSAAAAQVFNVDCIGLYKGDQSYGSWNDPNRGALGGPIALINPEDLGGAAIASGSLANTIYWIDSVVLVGGKLLGFLMRYTPVGVFQNTIHVVQWDGTTHAFESITVFTTSDVIIWSSATYKDASFLYVIGIDSTAAPTARTHYIMRVPIGTPLTGTKEYWGGSSWTTTRASAAVIYTGFQTAIGGIVLISGVFNAIITIFGEGTVRRLTASVITGPYTDTGSIYTQPDMGSGLVAYFARIHEQFDDNLGVLMSYSVNGSVGGVNSLGNIRYYAPKFFRGPASPAAALTPITDWGGIRIIESGTVVDNIGDLHPGDNFQGRVRAADTSGNFGLWTNSNIIRLVDDVTPPNKPSTPMISPQFKGVRIEWDGTDFQGGPPPVDWYKMEVHLSEVAAFQPGPLTLVDTYLTRLGGVTPVQGLDYGHTYYTRFVAIDYRNNRSLPSDVASSGLEQLVDTTEIANKLIQGAMIADSAISVRSLTVAAFEPSLAPNGGFEVEATDAAGVGLGLPFGWSSSFWTIGAGAVVAYDTTTPISGLKSVQMTMAAAADGLRYQSSVFPVTEGKLLACSVKVRASRAIANPAFELHIVCGNTEANTGAFPSAGVSVWGTSATVVGTTAVQTLELQRIVDASMKFARVFVTCLNANDGLGGWIGTIDDVAVLPVGGSAFIADASILNAKIANLAVNDAKIATVSAGKLTVGSLTADVTVSARIKTSNTGARVELNSSGLQAFNTGGSQTVDVSSATGSVVIVGTLVTGFTGTRLLIDSSAANNIAFYPSSGVNYSRIAASEDAAPSANLFMETGTFTYNSVTTRHRIFMQNASGFYMGSIAVSGSTTNGGIVFLGASNSSFSQYNSGGTQDGGQVIIDATYSRMLTTNSATMVSEVLLQDDAAVRISGSFINNRSFSNNARDAIISGSQGASGSFTGVTTFTTTYGGTATSTPGVVYSPIVTGFRDFRMTSYGTTSFVVDMNGTATAVAVGFHYWAYRQI